MLNNNLSIQSFTNRDHDKGLIIEAKEYILKTYKDIISECYIEESFNNFFEGFIHKDGETVIGACIWEIKEQTEADIIVYSEDLRKYMYILILCNDLSKYEQREMMLNNIYKCAKDYNISYIFIEPEHNLLLEFYRKNNFDITSTLPTVLMKRKLELFYDNYITCNNYIENSNIEKICEIDKLVSYDIDLVSYCD